MSSEHVRNLRVLHVLDHSIPLHSGYTFRTAAILREQRRLSWQTFHLTSPKHLHKGQPAIQSALSDEVVDGLHFFRTSNPPGALASLPVWGELDLMRRTAQRLLEVARNVNPHILHAHSPVLNALPALHVGRKLKIPVVYEIRAFWEDAAVDHGTTYEGSLRYWLTRAAETYALRRADHVFTICEGLRSDILARGISTDRVTVIPNAVDIEAFEPGGWPDEELKSKLGLKGATVLGFIGSFYAYEGLDLLVQALPHVLRCRPEVRLLFVGGGPQEDALKAQVMALKLQDKVMFAGRVPHEQVKNYYNLIDILTYPRHRMRLTELVTPLKPLEAMAQGRLLVASDVGGHRELIEHGRNGYLFRAGDVSALANCLINVLEQPSMWGEVRRIARRFVEEQRNWKKSVSGYASAYESVCL